MNFTISLGEQSNIMHNFSTVKRVMFLPFFKLSKVLLSIPPEWSNAYCDTFFSFIVFHKGS